MEFSSIFHIFIIQLKKNQKSDIITQDILFEGLGLDWDERRKRYRDYVQEERVYDKILDTVLKL